MNILDIWILAIGLAMDCLAVSVASGIILKRVEWRTILFMSLTFAMFQAAMPIIGCTIAGNFSHLIEDIDHWIAFAILAFLGINMIRESFRSEEDKRNYDPSKPKVVFTLAIATSIDALAIGVSFACLNMNSVEKLTPAISIIGFVTFVFSFGGLFFGIFFGKKRNWHMELWGGLILIGIGLKILMEHILENK